MGSGQGVDNCGKIQVQSIYMYVGIEENLTKPPTTSGQLLVRLHYREMDILLNHGIRLDFRNG